ncbi:hypothetical protein HK098_007616 [Nowakowskiella sp. JEL0407]|nr:hypothetical protein HK098_007616 [Nowakowskiella sp. JEL0407]
MDCSSVILYPSNPVSTLRNYTFKDVTFDDSNQNSKQPLVEHINSLKVVSPSPSLHGDDLEIENCDPIYFPLLKEFISSITLHRLEVGMTDDDTTYAVANIVKHCTSLRILIAYLMDNTDSWLSLDASAAFRDAVIQSTTLRELHVPRSLSLESTDVFTENQTLKAITFLECGELPESLEFFRWIEMNENRLKNENSSLKSVSFVYPDEEPIRLVDFHFLENRLKAVIYDLKNQYYSDTRLIHRLCERIVDGWRNEVPDSRIIDRLVLDNVRDDHWDLIWKYVLIVMEKKLELESKSFDKLKAKLQFGMVDGEYCLWFN